MTSGDDGRGQVHLDAEAPVARLHIDRPGKLNTFTASMSEQLVGHCAVIAGKIII